MSKYAPYTRGAQIFQQMYEKSKNSRDQKGDKKQVPK